MAVLTVRNLDANVKSRLRVQAAVQGIAMEESVRRILTRAANESPTRSESGQDLSNRIRARFVGLHGLTVPPRSTMRISPFADAALPNSQP